MAHVAGLSWLPGPAWFPKCHGSSTLEADSLEDGSTLEIEQLPAPNRMNNFY